MADRPQKQEAVSDSVDPRNKEWMQYATHPQGVYVKFPKKHNRRDWPRFVIHNYRGA